MSQNQAKQNLPTISPSYNQNSADKNLSLQASKQTGIIYPDFSLTSRPIEQPNTVPRRVGRPKIYLTPEDILVRQERINQQKMDYYT